MKKEIFYKDVHNVEFGFKNLKVVIQYYVRKSIILL